MKLHITSSEDLQEEYDRGYNKGFEDGVNAEQHASEMTYQVGQVLMRNKCLQVIQKYYGSSVYDYLREKIMEISLEE